MQASTKATRVIDNLEVDRLREEDAAKEEGKRQRKATKAVRGKVKETWSGRGSGDRMGRRGGAAIGSIKVAKPTLHEILLAFGGPLGCVWTKRALQRPFYQATVLVRERLLTVARTS